MDVCCLQEIMWKTAQILDLLQEKMLYLRFSGEACIAVHQKWIENIYSGLGSSPIFTSIIKRI